MNETLAGKNLLWLLEAATDAMLVADDQGRIRHTNAALERMFGYNRDELGQRSVEDLIPERFRAKHHQYRDAFAASPHSRSMGSGVELFALRQDGTEFPVDVSLSPLPTETGMFVLATIHDITRRKRAEEVGAQQMERLRAILETALDAIIVIDEKGLIDRFNPAAERLFGYAAQEALGRNVSLLMPAPYAEAHDGYLARYLQTGEKHIIGIGREVTGRRKDGTTFPLELAVTEMRLGDRRMFTGIVRDITERKQAEERQAALIAELEAANEELKNFAYVVSHDLKAPLRAIGSLADWLLSDYAERLDDQGKEYLNLLHGRVQRLDRLIEGILEYSRVGRIREVQVAVDLNELIQEILQLLAPPPHIEVVIETPLPSVVGERTRLQQLFQNLISNAVKYMDKPEGRIRVGCSDDGSYWRCYVADNGPGIEERHFERIFHLFQTLAPRDRVEGSGVGLALVKKIVELYGGRVWIESKIGEGSTFFFTLPKHGVSLSTQGGTE
jgi:two-component system sensor kinase FixL